LVFNQKHLHKGFAIQSATRDWQLKANRMGGGNNEVDTPIHEHQDGLRYLLSFLVSALKRQKKVCRIFQLGAVILVNMTANDCDLLRQFSRDHSQDAFTELVNQHMNLVYSSALRQVRSAQLAEEVTQVVFTNLARNADKLAPDTILTAWLYQVTRNAAIDLVRSEARRQAREQIAIQMSDINDTSADWTRIEPLLDEAMQSLEQTDRSAILLRYFQSKSLREVGEALGTSEDAAQKRVQRAVERLREFFFSRKVNIGAGALITLVCANAIQAAPAGLAAFVASSAVAASASSAVTITKIIAMTTLQKALITTVVVAAIGAGFYQAHQVHNLRQQVQTLEQSRAAQEAMSQKAGQMEHERPTNTPAVQIATGNTSKKGPNEVLRLRGEVGRLRLENAQMGATNALSKATVTPEARKLLRDVQKVGMAMIYKGFAQQAKLTPEQTEKLNDLLADHIMKNVDNTTMILRDKLAPEQMNALFAAQNTDLQEQVAALVGAEGLAQYQEYNKDLLATLSAQQFKTMLDGTDADKEQKATKLSGLIQGEAQKALEQAGLPGDYQTVPMLNFGNIASEQQGEQSLKLLESIYQQVSIGAGSFLSPSELAKFQQFTSVAISNNRGSLTMNRAIMAPIGN
jgi:RNA polymerase sigma factor (sigma-70 family)